VASMAESDLWLADGSGSEAARLGSCPPQGLCLRRPALQLDALRAAPVALGMHRHFGLRASAGLPLGRGPCLEEGSRRRLEAVRAVAALGLGWTGQAAVGQPAYSCVRVGKPAPRRGRHRRAADREGYAGLRSEPSRADG